MEKSFAGKVSTLSLDSPKADWGKPPMQKSQANLPTLKHLAACTAQALLTLTCAWNRVNVLQPTCPGDTLQLNDHLGDSTAKPWAAAPGQLAPRLFPWSCICPHLASHLRPVAVQGSRGGPWTPPRTHPSMPSPEIAVVACLSRPGRRVQQLLLLPGWLGGQSGAQKPRFSPCSCCG